jgi:hypothetical protein
MGLIAFYRNVILPELALPRHPHGQANRKYLPVMTSHKLKFNASMLTFVYFILYFAVKLVENVDFMVYTYL